LTGSCDRAKHFTLRPVVAAKVAAKSNQELAFEMMKFN
jgi:hypothetical protein